MLQTGFWSTEGALLSNRVDYWRQAICEAIFELDFSAPANGLKARLRQCDIGAVKLSEVSISTAHEVTRSREAAIRNVSPRFNLNYIRRGSWTVEHYGREIELQAGELLLFDNRQPYRIQASAGTEHIAVHLPIEWLRCWIPSPEDAIARPIRIGDPWRSTLAAALDDASLMEDSGPGTNDLCAQQIAGALALALGPTRSRNTTHTRLIFLRIQRTIADMFFDHELDATKVAAALAISPRYLHKILAREDTSYGRELIRIRLERAKTMLGDRRFDALPVSEIGWRCGFCDPSHFSRRFKSDIGVSPGAFRDISQAPTLLQIAH